LSIGLTGRSPARARASTSPRTLTVTGANPAGKPDSGDLAFVDNVDNSGAPGTGTESVIKFVVTASRASSHYQLSATSRDVYTWHTRPGPGVTIPAPWLCDSAPVPVSADRHCAVQPMMTLEYSVAGLAMNGTTRPGHQALTISVGHIQLATPSPIASTRVQVSFDNGRTWHATRVTRLPDGRFRAVFTTLPDAAVTLRTNATDTAGGSITEIITSAYQTAP
jgi:hypothetical protein